MEKLRATKKITLATLKAFARRNKDRLFFKMVSDFDGMVDCVMPNKNAAFRPTEISGSGGYYKTGIQGIYTVGSGRDYFKEYEDETFYGISVSNSCGETILAVKKS